MAEQEGLTNTVLAERHAGLGARMGPFGGYWMPIQYEGILKEHAAARESIALFDTCHMGEIHVTGDTAEEDLERLVSCAVGSLPAGRCRYGLLCNESGGVLDDLLVYRFGAADFMLVVNAGTRQRDLDWVVSQCSTETVVEDRSFETAKIDVQGPGSPRLLESLMDWSLAELRYFGFMRNRFRGHDVLLSRTGYTGEIGFELYCEAGLGPEFWDACIEGGATPAGLGARDTLRLEMGMPLYGHELDSDINAADSGMTWAIADKEFIGSAVIRAAAGDRRLAGLLLDGRRAARHGDAVVDCGGREIGRVTSGSFAPSLGQAIAMAYVDAAFQAAGTAVRIRTARSELEGTVCARPFYRGGTARKQMREFLG